MGLAPVAQAEWPGDIDREAGNWQSEQQKTRRDLHLEKGAASNRLLPSRPRDATCGVVEWRAVSNDCAPELSHPWSASPERSTPVLLHYQMFRFEITDDDGDFVAGFNEPTRIAEDHRIDAALLRNVGVAQRAGLRWGRHDEVCAGSFMEQAGLVFSQENRLCLLGIDDLVPKDH